MSKIHNFSAGPAILPQVAIDNSIEALKDFAETGLSLITVSHRAKEFVAVMDQAVANAKELFGIGDDYDVIFIQGGASTQFCMVPFNLLPINGKAAYLNTGTWATNAIKEAEKLGNVEVVASSEESNFNFIPKNYSIPNDAAYFHITTNNTIYGTELHEDLDVNVPLIADMSSDIYSRPVDVSKYDLIYAGAQKNIGPAGTTMVIVKKGILGKTGRNIPTMLNYETHIKKESMFNTPPVFPIFVVNETFKWLKSIGGVEEIYKLNKAKAQLLYNEIDNNPLFKGTAAVEDRSIMNVTFVLKNDSLDADFLDYCKNANISGIKGHRSVGGFRASLYNALPIESVQALVDVMQAFSQKFG
ncbi:MAG: 3-phosphoserine/phosphohydroxythreonine transaminase [Bacteroidetes bacterium]|nr:3-phosphoserine/phosphohydroxythreonine transaminase [Bacteroidota bacterium]